MPHTGDAPSLAKNKTFRLILLLAGAVAVAIVIGILIYREAQKEIPKASAVQIYPNYVLKEDVNQVKVPLIPVEQQLSREAGGWVITPAGSNYRVDYKIPVVVEYIDGRKFQREPNKPAWDGVRPANSIFRLYGKEGEYATVTIKRGVY